MIEIRRDDPFMNQHWEYDEELYCPYCGQQTIYVERYDYDDVGQQHQCVACDETFFLPCGGYDVKRRDIALRVLKEHYVQYVRSEER